jgi:hypothetical protein
MEATLRLTPAEAVWTKLTWRWTVKDFYDLRHKGRLVLRSDRPSFLLVRLCEEVCPSTLRPISPAMLMKAYGALRGGQWTVKNTVSGSSLVVADS